MPPVMQQAVPQSQSGSLAFATATATASAAATGRRTAALKPAAADHRADGDAALAAFVENTCRAVIYTCFVPGCNKIFKSPATLCKHIKAKHTAREIETAKKQPPRERCTPPGSLP